MEYLLGIDIDTSATKTVLFGTGVVHKAAGLPLRARGGAGPAPESGEH